MATQQNVSATAQPDTPVVPIQVSAGCYGTAGLVQAQNTLACPEVCTINILTAFYGNNLNDRPYCPSEMNKPVPERCCLRQHGITNCDQEFGQNDTLLIGLQRVCTATHICFLPVEQRAGSIFLKLEQAQEDCYTSFREIEYECICPPGVWPSIIAMELPPTTQMGFTTTFMNPPNALESMRQYPVPYIDHTSGVSQFGRLSIPPQYEYQPSPGRSPSSPRQYSYHPIQVGNPSSPGVHQRQHIQDVNANPQGLWPMEQTVTATGSHNSQGTYSQQPIQSVSYVPRVSKGQLGEYPQHPIQRLINPQGGNPNVPQEYPPQPIHQTLVPQASSPISAQYPYMPTKQNSPPQHNEARQLPYPQTSLYQPPSQGGHMPATVPEAGPHLGIPLNPQVGSAANPSTFPPEITIGDLALLNPGKNRRLYPETTVHQRVPLQGGYILPAVPEAWIPLGIPMNPQTGSAGTSSSFPQENMIGNSQLLHPGKNRRLYPETSLHQRVPPNGGHIPAAVPETGPPLGIPMNPQAGSAGNPSRFPPENMFGDSRLLHTGNDSQPWREPIVTDTPWRNPVTRMTNDTAVNSPNGRDSATSDLQDANIGGVVGGVLGAVVAMLLIFIALLLFKRRQQRKRHKEAGIAVFGNPTCTIDAFASEPAPFTVSDNYADAISTSIMPSKQGIATHLNNAALVPDKSYINGKVCIGILKNSNSWKHYNADNDNKDGYYNLPPVSNIYDSDDDYADEFINIYNNRDYVNLNSQSSLEGSITNLSMSNKNFCPIRTDDVTSHSYAQVNKVGRSYVSAHEDEVTPYVQSNTHSPAHSRGSTYSSVHPRSNTYSPAYIRSNTNSPIHLHSNTNSPGYPRSNNNNSPAYPRSNNYSPAHPRSNTNSPVHPRRNTYSLSHPRGNTSPAHPRSNTTSPAHTRSNSNSPIYTQTNTITIPYTRSNTNSPYDHTGSSNNLTTQILGRITSENFKTMRRNSSERRQSQKIVVFRDEMNQYDHLSRLNKAAAGVFPSDYNASNA